MTAPVISVGNISMGGTGKTPFTLLLARHFTAQGKRVCILSRGYKGGAGYGTLVVSDGKNLLHTPPYAADEPYMMAAGCPEAIVITGKERVKSHAFAEAQFKPDIYLLDDGFQHRRMHRDVDILLMDHARPVSTGFPFPFGYLREFPSAIRRADIVIFTRATDEAVPAAAKRYVADKPVFFSNVMPDAIVHAGERKPLSDIAGKRVALFSGLAKNESFFTLVRSLGAEVASAKGFADHHAYSAEELTQLVRSAQKDGCQMLLTTEKDFVKIPSSFHNQIMYLSIGIRLNNEQSLFNTLSEKLTY